METEGRIGQLFSKISEKLNDQVWFQQLRSKWEELDPRHRFYAQIGGAVLLLLVVVGWMGMAYWNVYSLKRELAEKQDLLHMVQSANDEMRRLRETGGSRGGGMNDGVPWPEYLTSAATNAGIDASKISVTNEKPAPSTSEIQETLMDIQLKQINIRQIMRFTYQLETGGRPLKVRNLAIDTGGEDTGWLNATLSVSGFTAKQ